MNRSESTISKPFSKHTLEQHIATDTGKYAHGEGVYFTPPATINGFAVELASVGTENFCYVQIYIYACAAKLKNCCAVVLCTTRKLCVYLNYDGHEKRHAVRQAGKIMDDEQDREASMP